MKTKPKYRMVFGVDRSNSFRCQAPFGEPLTHGRMAELFHGAEIIAEYFSAVPKS